MGIVKFIELGVWPIKLCLYCFNTSGSLHLNLPRVMSEMNTPTSSKIPSTDPWICMESRSFPVLSAGMVMLWNDRDVQGRRMHRDVSRPAHCSGWSCWFFPWCRRANFGSPTRAETCPEMRSSCLPKRSRLPTANLDILEASAGLLLSMEEGFWERFLSEQVCW